MYFNFVYGILGLIGLFVFNDYFLSISLLSFVLLFFIKYLLFWYCIFKTSNKKLVAPVITICYIVIDVILYVMNILIFISVIILGIINFNLFIILVFFMFIIKILIEKWKFLKQDNNDNKKVNILTYNIQRGFGLDNKFDINRTCDTINNINPEIICLQEVTPVCFDYLKDKLKNKFDYYLDGTENSCELAIFSKYPIEEVLKTPGFVDISEDRGIIGTKLLINNEMVWILTTHLSPDAFGNKQVLSVKKIIDIGLTLHDKFILCGDFNSIPGSVAIQYLNQNLTNLWNMKICPFNFGFTAFSQPLSEKFKFLPQYYFRLDHIFIKKMQSISINVNSSKASDHKPLFANISFK